MRMRVKFSRIFPVLTMAVAIAGAGCGVKSAPIPPEYAKPAKILDLEAINAADGVKLSWHRPLTYAGGGKMNDLAAFTLNRAADGGPFLEITRVPITDQGRFQIQRIFNFRDTATTMGQTYRYEVISNTTDVYISDPSNIATIIRKKPAPPPNPANYVLPSPVPVPFRASPPAP